MKYEYWTSLEEILRKKQSVVNYFLKKERNGDKILKKKVSCNI